MGSIEIDVETRSPINLKKCGAYVYFEHPLTEVLIASYILNGDGKVRRWERGQPCPPNLKEAIEAGATISAHNAGFEYLALKLLHERQGWPEAKPDQFRCTAATAAALALPRDLAGLGAALGLSVQKDREGTRLIRLFSVPRKPRKGEDPSLIIWNEPEDFPEDFEKFKDYCDQDVLVEAEADRRMVPLMASEQKLWLLSEKINRRGIRIDRNSAYSAIRLADKSKTALDNEMRRLTDGHVTACSQAARLVTWVNNQGVELDSAAKAEVTELLQSSDIPDRVRKALETRQEAAKTSVSKLTAMLDRASADGRVRGSFMFHGARTGRWASMGVNFSNLPRSRGAFEDVRTDVLFDAFKAEDPDLLTFLYGDDLGKPLHLLSDAIRGFIWAAPGHDLIQADFSNVEGNILAWLAEEEWKLEAIREINANPEMPDMYRRTAASILGLPIEEVTKRHWARQEVGKPAELGLGFGGGVMAFVTFANAYGVDLDKIAGSILAQASGERLERAVKRYEGQAKRGLSGTDILSRDAWIACEVVKLGWREQNSAIAKSWRDVESAARDAVANPGQVFTAAKVSYLHRNGFLWARLPSGRCLAYGSPQLKDQVWAKVKLDDGSWSDSEVMDRATAERDERAGKVQIEGYTSAAITALGVDPITKKWTRSALYGGLLVENNTQATARDLLVNGMWKAEAAGYPIIITVYDEIVAEVPRGFGDLEEFERLICELPDWAEGLPLKAGGWRGKRYRKD